MKENIKKEETYEHPILKGYNVRTFEEFLNDLASDDALKILNISEKTSEIIKDMCKFIKYTQLRTIHNELIKGVENTADLSRIMHKFAYFQARQENANAKKFVEFIRLLAKAVIKQEEENLLNVYKDYLDSIVAYHKLNCN